LAISINASRSPIDVVASTDAPTERGSRPVFAAEGAGVAAAGGGGDNAWSGRGTIPRASSSAAQGKATAGA